MNVQANLSILICYILMGQKFQKFQKSIFQFQSLTNIVFQYAPMHGSLAIVPWPPGGGGMTPSLGTTGLEVK